MPREYGHIQEVILQNFVPAPALLRRGAGGDRDRRRGGLLAHRVRAPPRAAAAGMGVRGRHRRSAANWSRSRASCCPMSASRCRRTSRSWPELVAAGATDLGGLSPTATTSRPSTRSPRRRRAPPARRGRRRADRAPLRLRAHIDREWLSQGVLDVINSRYWSFIPRRGSGPRRPRDPPRSGGRRDRSGCAGETLSEDELTALFAETRPGGDRGDPPGRRRAAGGAGGRRSRSSSAATSTSRTSASSAARSAASVRGRARPTPTSTTARRSRRRSPRRCAFGATEICMQSGSTRTGSSRTMSTGCA